MLVETLGLGSVYFCRANLHTSSLYLRTRDGRMVGYVCSELEVCTFRGETFVCLKPYNALLRLLGGQSLQCGQRACQALALDFRSSVSPSAFVRALPHSQ